MAVSDNRREYLNTYHKEKLRRIPLDIKKDWYDSIKLAANTAGESINGYIKEAIKQRMEREKGPDADTSEP